MGAGAAAWALVAPEFPLLECGEVLGPPAIGERFCMIVAKLLFVASKVV